MEKTKEEILKERADWYSKTFVQMEIVKALHHRELAFLTIKTEPKELRHSIRYCLAFSIDYLLKHIIRFDFHKSLMNMYESVAVLQDVPVFSYNLKERRSEEEYRQFNENYKDYVVGYDIFFDIDGKEDFKKAYQDATELKKVLEEYKLRYYVLNSSKRGFHFRINANFVPINEDIDAFISKISKVLYNIKGIHDFTTLDISIGDIKRLCKVPYSYSCDNSICLPLSDEQFANFSEQMVEMDNVLASCIIKNRGLLERNATLTDEEARNNTLKFLEDYS